MTNIDRFNALSGIQKDQLRAMLADNPRIKHDALRAYDLILHSRTACASQVALYLGLDVERAAHALRLLERAGAVRRDTDATEQYHLPVFNAV